MNDDGQVASDQEGALTPLSYTYDARGRVASVSQGVAPDTRTTTFGYGTDDFVRTVTDPLHEYVYDRDLVGRITNVSLPGGSDLGLRYDAAGGVAGVTPPGRGEHAFDHTEAGRISSYTPPAVAGSGSDATAYSYDDDRDLTTVDGPGSRGLALGYDTAGRLATVDFDRGRVTYGYHATTGQPTSVTAPGAETLTYTYDGMLLKTITSSGTSAGTVTYGYDTVQRRNSVTVNGIAAAFGFNADDEVTSAAGLTLTWFPGVSRLSGSSIGVVSTSYTNNAFGEPATRTATVSGTSQLATSYVRDKLGRVTERTETVGGVTTVTTYGYDERDRVEYVTVDGTLVRHYDYDANDNRTAVTTPGGTTSATYDARDRLATYGGNTYTYTADGYLATKTSGSGQTAYTYDDQGSLTRVVLPGSPTIDYLIDGAGRRVGKKVNGALAERYVYGDDDALLAQLDAAGAVTATFVFAGAGGAPELVVKGATKYRVVKDALGSPRLLVNTTTGAVAQRIDYDEYGNVTLDTSPGFQPFGFAGGHYDAQTGLTRFGLRDYDAETGRFTARDPSGFDGGSANLYTYAGADPVNYVDRSGLRVEVPDDPIPGKPQPDKVMRDLNGTIMNCTKTPSDKKDERPRLDQKRKVHGKLPEYVTDDWTDEELEDLAEDLETSIKTRKDELVNLGDEPGHRRRINEDLRLLKQILKKLGRK